MNREPRPGVGRRRTRRSPRPDAGHLPAARRSAAPPIPGVEFESCASGGGRVDLGILERTERIWTSDCNDALERQVIQAGHVDAHPAGADGHPHRRDPCPHDGTHPHAWRSGRPPRCSVTSGSSGTCSASTSDELDDLRCVIDTPQAPPRRCCTPATSCASTSSASTPLAHGVYAGRPLRGRSSPTSSSARTRPRPRPRCACPGLDPAGATASSRCRCPAGGHPMGSGSGVAGQGDRAQRPPARRPRCPASRDGPRVGPAPAPRVAPD